MYVTVRSVFIGLTLMRTEPQDFTKSDARIGNIITVSLVPIWLAMFVAWWMGKLSQGAFPVTWVWFAGTGSLIVYRLWGIYRRRDR